jgi:tetratricopeptide (TPR) repeat protein
MMKAPFILLFTTAAVFVAVMVSAPAAAQTEFEAELPAFSTAASPDEVTRSLPEAVRLTDLRPVWQQVNRCAAAALAIQMSYFGWNGTYDEVIRYLNTHPEDVAVRLEEMGAFAELHGLRWIARFGGTVDLLKLLIAEGFPVLIENSYYDGPGGFRDWMSHNRVMMGYDDAQGLLYAFDSLLGNGPDGRGRPFEYADIEERWRPFNRDYLLLYHPEDEDRVRELLGEDHWDPVRNAELALAQSQAEIDEGRADSYTYFNIGTSLLVLERYEEAAEAFDIARRTGLPWRMLWYQYGPFEAYYHVGRYDDVIALARQVIDTTPGVEETYYYIGLAAEALGDTQRAIANLEVAVMRNANFTEAIEALVRIRGAQGN